MLVRLSAIIFAAAMLAACSDSSPNFTTRGLVAPQSQCLVDPRQVGDAERVDDIDERNGCMVENAWRMRSVAGVSLSQPAVVNCGVVSPLNDWMANKVQPAAQSAFGESVVSVDVLASYSCRPRNNRDGAKMSEHGFRQCHRRCRLHIGKRPEDQRRAGVLGLAPRQPFPSAGPRRCMPGFQHGARTWIRQPP